MHNVERALIHLSEVDVIRICQGISSTGSLIIMIDYLIFFHLVIINKDEQMGNFINVVFTRLFKIVSFRILVLVLY